MAESAPYSSSSVSKAGPDIIIKPRRPRAGEERRWRFQLFCYVSMTTVGCVLTILTAYANLDLRRAVTGVDRLVAKADSIATSVEEYIEKADTGVITVHASLPSYDYPVPPLYFSPPQDTSITDYRLWKTTPTRLDLQPDSYERLLSVIQEVRGNHLERANSPETFQQGMFDYPIVEADTLIHKLNGVAIVKLYEVSAHRPSDRPRCLYLVH